MTAIFILCVLLFAGSSAESQAGKPPHSKVTEGVNSQDTALAAKIESLEKAMKSINARISLDEEFLNNKQDMHSVVVLDPSHLHVYQRLDSDTMQFLVSLESVTPYLNGYKLVIDVGNPTTARLHGATITCTWSKAYDWAHYSQESYKAWQAALHSSKIDVTNEIVPGSWNPIEINLLPASQDELEYLAVSIQPNTISLTGN